MKLTVKELKRLIEGQPDDAEVLVNMLDGCCGDKMDLEVEDAETSIEHYEKKPGYIVLTVHAVPGYKSCIQAGGTKRADEMYWRRTKTFMARTLAGETIDIGACIEEWNKLSDYDKNRNNLHDWLGMTLDEYTSYVEQSRTLDQIVEARRNKTTAEQELQTVLRHFGMFRMRTRNALGRAGIASNPGWNDEDVVKAVEKLANQKLVEAPPANSIKLAYLRKEAKMCRECADSLRLEAAKEHDNEKWMMANFSDGQAAAFEQMIGYTRGFNHRQMGVAKRKGVL